MNKVQKYIYYIDNNTNVVYQFENELMIKQFIFVKFFESPKIEYAKCLNEFYVANILCVNEIFPIEWETIIAEYLKDRIIFVNENLIAFLIESLTNE